MIVTLKSRFANSERAMPAWSTGGASSVSPVNALAASACPPALRSCDRTRPPARSGAAGPPWPPAGRRTARRPGCRALRGRPSRRMFTGTIARRPRRGGSSPRASSSARSAPAAAASTTSLTVPPSAARTSFSSWSSTWTVATRRVVPIGTFRLELGAAISSSRTSRSITARERSNASRGCITAWVPVRAAARPASAVRRTGCGAWGSQAGRAVVGGDRRRRAVECRRPVRRGLSVSSSRSPASTEPTPSTRQ